MSQPPSYVRYEDHSDYQAFHQLPGPALSGAALDALGGATGAARDPVRAEPPAMVDEPTGSQHQDDPL